MSVEKAEHLHRIRNAVFIDRLRHEVGRLLDRGDCIPIATLHPAAENSSNRSSCPRTRPPVPAQSRNSHTAAACRPPSRGGTARCRRPRCDANGRTDRAGNACCSCAASSAGPKSTSAEISVCSSFSAGRMRSRRRVNPLLKDFFVVLPRSSLLYVVPTWQPTHSPLSDAKATTRRQYVLRPRKLAQKATLPRARARRSYGLRRRA